MSLNPYDYIVAARVNHREQRYVASWHNLFEMMIAIDESRAKKPAPDRTPRQKEIQRLWQQRGLLERTKANVRSVLADKTMQWYQISDKGFLSSAITILEEQITINSNNMKLVKERISNA